jgi:hypothetical protein
MLSSPHKISISAFIGRTKSLRFTSPKNIREYRDEVLKELNKILDHAVAMKKVKTTKTKKAASVANAFKVEV